MADMRKANISCEHELMNWCTKNQLCTRKLSGKNLVQLVVSPLFGALGRAIGAYHTSVIVGGFEYYFDRKGLRKRKYEGVGSHHDLSDVIDIGGSIRTGDDLCDALKSHFTPGSYDLILKNCNSFTDAAIHFLLGVRLCRECSLIEHVLSPYLDMLESITLGCYSRNPEAIHFCIEDVIALFMSFSISC